MNLRNGSLMIKDLYTSRFKGSKSEFLMGILTPSLSL